MGHGCILTDMCNGLRVWGTFIVSAIAERGELNVAEFCIVLYRHC